MNRLRLAVLASGRGSNFVAIQDAIERGDLDAEIVLLLSDRAEAPALDLARGRGIRAEHLPYDRKDREAFERAAGERIQAAGADLVILAGFMRLLTPYLVKRFAGRILNIHPALLPAFKGLDAQQQALDYGVKVSGCTVHIVTEDMDAGPILGQHVVPVLDGDTANTLGARILAQEHRLYTACIARYGARLQTPEPQL